MRLMSFELSAEHEQFRRTVRDFAEKEIAPHAAQWDREHHFPVDVVQKMGQLGLMGLTSPEEYGGAGMTGEDGGFTSLCLAIEEIGRVDQAMGITLEAAVGLGINPILTYGTDEQKGTWLPDLVSGQRLAGFGLTEPGAGSDAGATRTKAVLENGEWVVNGAKQFITNSGSDITSCVSVTARTGGFETLAGARSSTTGNQGRPEISAILVPADTPGFTAEKAYDKLGWRASDTHPLSFEDCRVPEANLLGRRGEGFKNFLHILDGGRIGVAAMGVGLAQGALDEAIAYAKERQAFGQAISKFQSIQAKIADLSAQIEAARLLTWRAALEKEAGKSFTLTAAQAKLITGRLAVRATEEAVQIHGGYGYIEEYPVCRFYRDAKILTIGEGTDEVQQMVIARQLGC
jgi:short-chain 2-methylacyl-CoA dehydrogenase